MEQKSFGFALRREVEVFQALLNSADASTGFQALPFRESIASCWKPPARFFDHPLLAALEKTFETFCQKETRGKCQIPSRIHLIWLGSPPPQQALAAMQSWKRHHPAWEIKLWTDADLPHFSWTNPHHQHLFYKAKNGSEKSDLLRFELMYQYGGIYSDTDVVCFKSFEPLLAKGAALIAGIEANWMPQFAKPIIGSAVFASTPKNPLMQRCLEWTQSAEEAPSLPCPMRSGPGPLTEACFEALQGGDASLAILPCSYLYPLPGEKRLCSQQELLHFIKPESFTIHLWEGSWLQTQSELLTFLRKNRPQRE